MLFATLLPDQLCLFIPLPWMCIEPPQQSIIGIPLTACVYKGDFPLLLNSNQFWHSGHIPWYVLKYSFLPKPKENMNRIKTGFSAKSCRCFIRAAPILKGRSTVRGLGFIYNSMGLTTFKTTLPISSCYLLPHSSYRTSHT